MLDTKLIELKCENEKCEDDHKSCIIPIQRFELETDGNPVLAIPDIYCKKCLFLMTYGFKKH